MGIQSLFGDLAGRDQEPGSVPAQQVGLTVTVRGQHGQLLGLSGERHPLESAGRGPDRHRALLVLPGQHPVVVRLRRLRPEDDRLARGSGVPFGAGPPVPSGPQVRLQGGVGVTGLLDRVLGSLRPQPPPAPDLGIGVLAQGQRAACILLERHLGGPGGRLVAGVQGRLKCPRLHGRWLQFDLHHQLHGHRTYTPVRDATARSPPFTRTSGPCPSSDASDPGSAGKHPAASRPCHLRPDTAALRTATTGCDSSRA